MVKDSEVPQAGSQPRSQTEQAGAPPHGIDAIPQGCKVLGQHAPSGSGKSIPQPRLRRAADHLLAETPLHLARGAPTGATALPTQEIKVINQATRNKASAIVNSGGEGRPPPGPPRHGRWATPGAGNARRDGLLPPTGPRLSPHHDLRSSGRPCRLCLLQ